MVGASTSEILCNSVSLLTHRLPKSQLPSAHPTAHAAKSKERGYAPSQRTGMPYVGNLSIPIIRPVICTAPPKRKCPPYRQDQNRDAMHARRVHIHAPNAKPRLDSITRNHHLPPERCRTPCDSHSPRPVQGLLLREHGADVLLGEDDLVDGIFLPLQVGGGVGVGGVGGGEGVRREEDFYRDMRVVSSIA